jgi:hypothetical protein
MHASDAHKIGFKRSEGTILRDLGVDGRIILK